MCDSGEKSEGKGRDSAVNIVGRIATMALALTSAVLMVTASQCTVYDYEYGAPMHTTTYSDYSQFMYLVIANVISAILEGIAIFLNIWKKDDIHKLVKFLKPLIDVVVPALLYSSTGASFGVDVSYCVRSGQRVSVCSSSKANSFCSQVHLSMYISLSSAFAVSFSELVKHIDLGSSKDSGPSSDSGCGHGCHHKH